MVITIPIPSDLERKLREDLPDLESAAKEAFLVSLYQQRRLTHKQLADLLALDRWQTEEILHRHGVSDLTPDEIDRQFDTLRKMGN